VAPPDEGTAIASRVGEGTVVTARFPRERLSGDTDEIADAASD